MLVLALELPGNDVHPDELLAAFGGVLSEGLTVCHAAAEGTGMLIDDNIDYCPVWYLSVGVQSINFVLVILDRASLPEFMDFPVCLISAVVVPVVQLDPGLYFSLS